MSRYAPGVSIQKYYPWLRSARPDVDWRNVNPVLLRQLNAMARSRHLIITIFSGYRSNAYSQKVGGFAGDPHTRGIAVDATVHGKPIGQVFSRKDFQRFGLRTGSVPNFYHGKPDPEHVDLVGTANEKASGAAPEPAAPSAPAAAPASTAPPGGEGAAVTPDYQSQIQSPVAQAPQALNPGTVQPGGFTHQQFAEMWKLAGSVQNVSQDTLNYLNLIGS